MILMEPVGRPRLQNSLRQNPQASVARSPLQTTLAVVGGAALLAAGLAFSLVVVAIVAVVGSIGFGVFWWKTRAMRRQMRAHMEVLAQYQTTHESMRKSSMPQDDTVSGDVIEGEIIRDERETPR